MNQQEQPAVPYSVERGDELSLIELWKVMLEYKLLIIVFTVLTTLLAIYYVSTLPTIYKAEVLMVPSSSEGGLSNRLSGLASMAGISTNNKANKAEHALIRLKTRSFLVQHIKEKNLKPILFSDQWSKTERKWINQEPSNIEAYELLSDMIIIDANPKNAGGFVTLSLEWVDPTNVNVDKMAIIANNLVTSINSHERSSAIVESKNSILFLEKELEKTSIIDVRTILYNLIEQQMNNIMMANVRTAAVFKVFDPAITPEEPEPKSIIGIIFLWSFLGLFFISFVVVSFNHFTYQLKQSKG